ncbi:ionotropic receptor 21a-like [Penaeus japonicus]|uniref:ionotropic receptor 21a-like n=1 Tax=Penaeus japonicus TaxID=27405 RepID=UPI001C70B6E9|nr:ionotropic receptor 21a-like [Penaeus japonicus]
MAGQESPPLCSSAQTQVVEFSSVSLRRKREIGKQDEKESSVLLSLSALLTSVVREELRDCALVIAVDQGFRDSAIVADLLRLPNLRLMDPLSRTHIENTNISRKNILPSSGILQVVGVAAAEDFYGILWEASQCRGYIFLLEDPKPLLDFVSTREDPWDFGGSYYSYKSLLNRQLVFVDVQMPEVYVIVGTSKEQLDEITRSAKGIKTEHIVGIVKSLKTQDWEIYMNLLFWGPGVAVVNRWRRGAFTSANVLFPDKVSDLKGATIKIVTFGFAPHVVNRAEEGLQKYGRDVELIQTMAQVLNFSASFREPPRGELWGTKLENGTWTGLVGALARNEGHLGVANIFLSDNNNRRLVQDFTQPYDADKSCFMARSAPPLPRWQSLALPFTFEVWIAVLLGVLFISPVLYLLAKGSEVSGEEMAGLQTLSSSGLYYWGILLRISQARVPVRSSTQILVAFLWICSVILTVGYSSNLTAFLTVSRTPSGIETFSQLYASRQGVIGMGNFFKISMVSSRNTYLNGLADRYAPYSDFGQALVPVKEGKGVFIESRKYLEYLINTQFTKRGSSSMRVMKECFAPYSVAVALQLHSPLKERLNLVLSRLVESGLVRQWFLETLRRTKTIKDSRSKDCIKSLMEGQDFINQLSNIPTQLITSITHLQRSDSSEGRAEEEDAAATQPSLGVIPLSLEHVEGIFLILLFGLVFSSLIFALEISLRRK